MNKKWLINGDKCDIRDITGTVGAFNDINKYSEF